MLGVLDTDEEFAITPDQFAKSYFILPYDLDLLGSNGYTNHTQHSGEILISLRLENALANPLTVLVYGVTENIIEVDPTNETYLDYRDKK